MLLSEVRCVASLQCKKRKHTNYKFARAGGCFSFSFGLILFSFLRCSSSFLFYCVRFVISATFHTRSKCLSKAYLFYRYFVPDGTNCNAIHNYKIYNINKSLKFNVLFNPARAEFAESTESIVICVPARVDFKRLFNMIFLRMEFSSNFSRRSCSLI